MGKEKKIQIGAVICAFVAAITFVAIVGTEARAGTKIQICHAPPGNPDNKHTISVSVSAVDSHLQNHPGDTLGQCGGECFEVDPNLNDDFDVEDVDGWVTACEENAGCTVEEDCFTILSEGSLFCLRCLQSDSDCDNCRSDMQSRGCTNVCQ